MNHDQLYCHRAVAYLQAQNGQNIPLKLVDHEDVARLVLSEYERLAISTNPQRFAYFGHAGPNSILLPQICYTSGVDSDL